jgi:hypothetical protein
MFTIVHFKSIINSRGATVTGISVFSFPGTKPMRTIRTLNTMYPALVYILFLLKFAAIAFAVFFEQIVL